MLSHIIPYLQGPSETWYSYRFRGKEESRVDPEENQHCLSSDYSFLGNSGLISSDGHGKANTTAGEEADKIRSMETISAGDGKLLPSLRGQVSLPLAKTYQNFGAQCPQLHQCLPIVPFPNLQDSILSHSIPPSTSDRERGKEVYKNKHF